jgi:hypothetical protein
MFEKTLRENSENSNGILAVFNFNVSISTFILVIIHIIIAAIFERLRF